MLSFREKKFKESKRDQKRCLPHRECTSDNTVENFSAEAQNFQAHSPDKQKALGKKYQMSSVHKITKSEVFLTEVWQIV